ncbi:ATP-binding protein [Pseudoxanthomonas daejeonensis]|uniref:ATP-binding protein n=1 Tax=Pseudoxanthomonas daejeonensis TaxID=266062 RepID=UPI001F542ECE|nr:ATP-binding protein [Pseudoxanthomonas daejeonensis]UNK58899.1 ATP-binding protein [Pseudoxanthomonas daejeonensis]
MSTATDAKTQDCSIIALDKFIQATRDSGYKSTAAALSELVDNSIQAGATRIAIKIAMTDAESGNGIEVSVLDNGCGMDPFTLRQALRFGGSTRFGDRSGLGRYGMGLPNASLSQARRVTVYAWQSIGSDATAATRMTTCGGLAKRVYMSYLDVDKIVQAKMVEIPRPIVVKSAPQECVAPSGTFIRWTHCDRLDNRRVSTIVRKVETELARRFRHYLRKRLKITINGEAIKAFDPLHLYSDAELSGASLFGEELRYEVPVNPSDPKNTGWVKVRFSELPVHEWHKLSNDEKRRFGISRGSGVSIVRAGREVDYGWFFMGGKSRENYDDWWRCEIQFDPVLDEAFGITHTKQQIRPLAHLIEAITPDLEATARELSRRVRRAHQKVKAGDDRCSDSERKASEREHLLRPLPREVSSSAKTLMRDLKKSHPLLRRKHLHSVRRYRIIEAPTKDKSFFSYARDGEQLILVLNPYHPFYRDIYKPLAEGESRRDQQLRASVELLLLAAARSEAAAGSDGATIARQRLEWSHALAAFLNDK